LSALARFISGALLVIVVAAVACGEEEATAPSAEEMTTTIVDSADREVAVVQPLERVVVLASQPAEVIAALGAQDKVIGVTENHVLRDPITSVVYQDKPSVGEILAPSAEKILELKPDLVISIGAWAGASEAALALDEQLKPHNIPVALIDCLPDIEAIVRDVRTLGKLFQKEQRAQEYVDFFQQQLDLVGERTQGLQSAERASALMDVTDYTVTDWGHKMIVAAGGTDIAADVDLPSATVSSEWVLERNPEVIVVRAMPANLLGYGVSSDEQAKQKWQEIIGRPGWELVDAVKNGTVYLLAFEVCSAPRAPIGILYMAKWFYPERFKDLDPGQVHSDFLERFFGFEEYEGIFVYPES